MKTDIDVNGEYTIKDAARLLDRKPHTLRNWEYWGILPLHLKPGRNDRDWRVWTGAQLLEIRDTWMKTLQPGSGLPSYHPTEAQRVSHIANIRIARRTAA